MRNTLRLFSASVIAFATFAFAASFPLITAAQSTSTVKVTISKFVDGSMAMASTTGGSSFPMSATWNATNIGAGSGTFSLGPTGFNTSTPYQAVTANMTSGASYSVSETSNANVGTNCASGSQPFQLAGYTTGTSMAAAQSATPSTTTPNFTNMTSDMFVIVWNKHCLAAPMPVSPSNGSATTTAGQTMVDWTDVTNPVGGITYMYQSSHSSTTNASGAFASPLFTSGSLASSSIATPGTPAGTYYWHARAMDAHGNTSPWSTTWSFIVANNGTTTPPMATSTLKVHVLKYLDGMQATASSSSSFLFPMMSTWKAANLNGGATTTGAYSLGNSHGGASSAYGADTSAMQSPAHYSTHEVTGTSTQVLPIGAQCTAGKYQLLGYTSSPISFAAAAAMTPSATMPTFSNLTADHYVIVWNKTCGGTTPPPPPPSGTGSLWVQKFAVGGNATFSFLGSGGIGAFTITTTGGHGSHTITGLAPGTYTVTEPTLPSGDWRRFINTCHNVKVKANQKAFCFMTNRVPVNQWDMIGVHNTNPNF